MTKTQSVWTETLVSEIAELWKTESAGSIASIINKRHGLNLTRNSVVGKIHRMGLGVADKTAVPKPQREKKEKKERKPILKIIPGFKTLRIIESTMAGVAPLRCVPLDPMHLSLDDIGRGQCRYPYGDNAPFTFCGHPKREASSYCTAHHFLCRTPAKNKKTTRAA